jgi:hypothetical protein
MGGGYVHAHVEGGEGLDDHQDEPVLPTTQCFRMTCRFTSALDVSSKLLMRHKGAGDERYALPLVEGYNLFEPYALGVTSDSPWLHGAPKATADCFGSVTAVFDFALCDPASAPRPHVREIVADYHMRAAHDAALLPVPWGAAAATGSGGASASAGSESGTVVLTATSVSQISSKAAHRSALFIACRDAVNVARAGLTAAGGAATDEDVAASTGLALSSVEGVARQLAGCGDGGKCYRKLLA